MVVKSLTEGGAAARAGTQIGVGDVLVSVDDRDIRGLGTDAIARLITGPEGSKVKLTLLSAAINDSSQDCGADLADTQAIGPDLPRTDSVYHVSLTRTLAGFIPGRPSSYSLPQAHREFNQQQAAEKNRSEGIALPDPAALAVAAAAGSLEELGRFREWLAQAGWPSLTTSSGSGPGSSWDDDDEMIV